MRNEQSIGRPDLRTLRSWFLAALAIFSGAVALGMILTYGHLESARLVFGSLTQGLVELGDTATEASAWAGILIIFGNNLLTCILAMVLSPLLGLFALFVLLLNGALLGFLAVVLQAEGVPLWEFFLLGILPHGLLELPAVFLSTGLGLRMGWQVLFPPAAASRGQALAVNMRLALALLPLLAGLLAVAAVVEVLITPWLLTEFGA